MAFTKNKKLMELGSTMTPIKFPNFKTSGKIEGRNLFGQTDNEDLNMCNFFKKFNFDDCCDDKMVFWEEK